MAFGKCDACGVYEKMLEVERGRYMDLFAAYERLRVTANPAEERKGLPVPTRSLKAADEAIETVVARYGNNPLLRKRLQRYVNMERQKNAEEDAIAHSVLHWRSPDDDEEAA